MVKFDRLCWLFGIGVFVGAMLLYHVHWNPDTTLAHTGYESLELGNSIALKGSFSDPFAPMPTGPSAHLAPGYPALIALIIKIFGTGPDGDFALGMLSKTVVAMQLALLPFLAEYLGLHWLTGVIAAGAWLFAGFPLLHWENDFAGLLIVILAFPMYKALCRELFTVEVAVTGVLWGLLLLVTPTPLPVLGAWLLCLLLVSRRSWRQVFLLALIPFVVVLPWLARNYGVFHKPVFLRDNLGIELAVSNNSCAFFSDALNRDQNSCFGDNHPNESYEQALRVRRLGEPTYNQVRLREAMSWINNNRQHFLALTTKRAVAFWFPNDTGNPLEQGHLSTSESVTCAATLLGIPGLFLLWRNSRPAAILFGLWLALFPLVYYLIQFSPRYRHPILWATFLPGGYLVVEFLSGITGWPTQKRAH